MGNLVTKKHFATVSRLGLSGSVQLKSAMQAICWMMRMTVALLTGFGLQAAECIAHRGDSIRHPDNTVEAIQSGWNMGADVVEVDVRMTSEGVLVLFHDADINKRLITDMTHKELDAAKPKYRVLDGVSPD